MCSTHTEREEFYMNDWKATGQKLGGLGRSKVFGLWLTGELASVKIGARRFSTDRQISAYIDQLESAAGAA